MIRAGRRACTQHHLAAKAGLSYEAFRKRRLRGAYAGLPEPITSEGHPLWDDEQVDSYFRGEPVGDITSTDHEDDLLSRREAAAYVGLDTATWDRYQTLPRLNPRPPEPVAAPGPGNSRIPVDHWRRGDLDWWVEARASDERQRTPGHGRPRGSTQERQREVRARVTALLDRDPAVTAQHAADSLDIGLDTARTALATARADAVEAVLDNGRPGDGADAAESVAAALGYPLPAARRALATVAARRRCRAAEPYVRRVADALAGEGYAVNRHVVRVRPGDLVGAAVYLGEGSRLPPVLVWDERYGWRTAPPETRLSTGEPTPPAGAGIRYFPRLGLYPEGPALLSALTDARVGSRRPPRIP